MPVDPEEQAYVEAKRVLRSLLLGVTPDTHKRLASQCVVMDPEVKTALALGVEALQTTQWVRQWKAKRKVTLPKPKAVAGTPLQRHQASAVPRPGQWWSPAEDRELHNAFRAGQTLEKLCQAHGRTARSILARLVRIGSVGSEEEAKRQFRRALQRL